MLFVCKSIKELGEKQRGISSVTCKSTCATRPIFEPLSPESYHQSLNQLQSPLHSAWVKTLVSYPQLHLRFCWMSDMCLCENRAMLRSSDRLSGCTWQPIVSMLAIYVVLSSQICHDQSLFSAMRRSYDKCYFSRVTCSPTEHCGPFQPCPVVALLPRVILR